MLGQMMHRPLLISSIIEFAEKFHGDREVVTRSVEGPIVRATWSQVAERSRRVGNALRGLGVTPGDRVATLGWNTQRHLELYFGVSGIGAVLHTINPRLAPDELRYVVNHAEDAVLFFDATFAPLAELLKASAPHIKHFIPLTAEGYEALVEGASASLQWPVFDENTASSLCYTSGTAGQPKGVLYSHRSTLLHSFAVAMADSLAISVRDVILPVVPMFHVNAWGVPYAAAMSGAKLVLPGPKLDGSSLTELIQGEHVNSLLGVPTVWHGLLAHVRAAGIRLEGVEKVVVGGSACPPTMIEAFEKEHGARVIHAWGMTETSPLGTANVLLPEHQRLTHQAQLQVKAKQGRPIFGIDLALFDDTGNTVAHDGKASGHLHVRGAWVADGYFKHQGLESKQPGWFMTGDIASIDTQGYLQITDRSKDVIKSGGEWISSILLENTALQCPGVAQAAAIAVTDPKWGERPLLCVVRSAGAQVTSQELAAFLSTRLSKWQVPERYEFVDALPLGPTGKVLKRELRSRFSSASST
jgi:3-(methylthio)propionyl---CoA ligase